MITFTLVVILGVLLAVVLKQLARKPAAAPRAKPASQVDIANLKVTDARPGDVISVTGAGDDMNDLDFTVERLTRVRAGTHDWVELEGSYRDRHVNLRAGGEPVETVLHSDPHNIALEDLGLSEDDLAQMDERQNTADNFEFDGKTWLYHLSREATATRDGQRDAQRNGFYYWEFKEQGGPGLLAISKPESEPFSVTRYRTIAPGYVNIYRGAQSA